MRFGRHVIKAKLGYDYRANHEETVQAELALIHEQLKLLEEKDVAIVRQARQGIDVIFHPDIEERFETPAVVTKERRKTDLTKRDKTYLEWVSQMATASLKRTSTFSGSWGRGGQSSSSSSFGSRGRGRPPRVPSSSGFAFKGFPHRDEFAPFISPFIQD
ncbi:hypothetical protein M9H77_02106 [Catharanthus roseus]|uniref:Uncharacterized protein n=1 Tax=Catharanthus roseus TaxID=4058 RepID=A0ACC0C7V3_CATRO|nr:hypothetical protein M9H77_02106 [Catharanthus roseus]